VWAVNPRHDTLESLFNYLARFAHEFLTPAKIRCRLQMPVDFVERPVRSEIRHNLFLAFKESLHNTVRHSGADEVQVGVTLEGDILRMVVSDNGRGSEVAPPAQRATPTDRIASGHGFANIQTRLARIGGQSRITSTPGQGMRVELQVSLASERPLKRDRPPA
jgi:signal transduction histidine kinase